MFGWIAAGVVALVMTLAGPKPIDLEKIYEDVRPTIAPLQYVSPRVSSLRTICTAVVVDADAGIFLSESHCHKKDARMYIAGLPAEMLWLEGGLVIYETADTLPHWRDATWVDTQPKPGADVAAIGYSAGGLQPFISSGIVSHPGSDRDMQLDIVFRMRQQLPADHLPLVPMDMHLWGGQSGGPIVNKKAEVVTLSRFILNTRPTHMAASAPVHVIQEAVARARSFVPKGPTLTGHIRIDYEEEF